MLEQLIGYVTSIPWEAVLLVACAITFFENVFPPAPCDTFIVFTGSLISLGTIGFLPLLLSTTLGSLLGFWFMFWLGRRYGRNIIHSKRFKFITEESVKRPNEWLEKYGYTLIAVNRFLSGTRGVLSFIAGMSTMKAIPSQLLAALSAAIWNSLLLGIGILLGNNWRVAQDYIKSYGQILLPVVIVIILIVVGRYFYQLRKAN